jgi:hypothetical protein
MERQRARAFESGKPLTDFGRQKLRKTKFRKFRRGRI